MLIFRYCSNSYPSICGKSNGHHMYIDIGRTASATASLKVSLASGSSAAKWNILTRQIECDTEWTAPDGNTLLPLVNALYSLLSLVTLNNIYFLSQAARCG